MTSMSDRLIVAIDYLGDDGLGPALATRLYIDAGIRFFKLRTSALLDLRGLWMVEAARESDADLMLDLKVYGTQQEVGETVKLAFAAGARFVTVHATSAGLRAAMLAKSEPEHKVLAVGPTSDHPQKVYNHWLGNFDIDLCDGVICPAMYLPRWRQYLTYHQKLAVCPAIRPAPDDVGLAWMEDWDYVGGHATCQTPAGAVRAGADYLVVGRPIYASPDPVAAARAIIQQMEEASA